MNSCIIGTPLENVVVGSGLFEATSCVTGEPELKHIDYGKAGLGIPFGIFVGFRYVGNHSLRHCEAHFKCDSGVLIETKARSIHGFTLLSHCSSFAVIQDCVGKTETIIWARPLLWEPRYGVLSGFIGQHLVKVHCSL